MSGLAFPVGTTASDAKAATTAGARAAPPDDGAFSGVLAKVAPAPGGSAPGKDDTAFPTFRGFDALKASLHNDDGPEMGVNAGPLQEATAGPPDVSAAVDVVAWAKSSALPASRAATGPSRPVKAADPQEGSQPPPLTTAAAPRLPSASGALVRPAGVVPNAVSLPKAADATIHAAVAAKPARLAPGAATPPAAPIPQAATADVEAGQDIDPDTDQNAGAGSDVRPSPEPASGKAPRKTVEPAKPEQPAAPNPAALLQGTVLDDRAVRIDGVGAGEGAGDGAKPSVVAGQPAMATATGSLAAKPNPIKPQVAVLDDRAMRVDGAGASASAGDGAKPSVVAVAGQPAMATTTGSLAAKPNPTTPPAAPEPESKITAALPAASTPIPTPENIDGIARNQPAASAGDPQVAASAPPAPAVLAVDQARGQAGKPSRDPPATPGDGPAIASASPETVPAPANAAALAAPVPVQPASGPIVVGGATDRKPVPPTSPGRATSPPAMAEAGPGRAATPSLDGGPSVPAVGGPEAARSHAVTADAAQPVETPVQQVLAALRGMTQDAPAGPQRQGDDASNAGLPSAGAPPKSGLAPAPLANREVTIQLNPEHLGSVSITMRLNAQTVDVRIAVANEQTLHLLNKDRHLLSAAVEAAGGTADALAMTSAPVARPAATATAGQDQTRPDASRQQASSAASGGNGERGARSAPSPSITVPEDDHAILPASRQSRVGDDLYL